METPLPEMDYPESEFETVENLIEYLQEVKYSVGRGCNERLMDIVQDLKRQRDSYRRRPVEVRVWNKETLQYTPESGTFHRWGDELLELSDGNFSATSAIVELNDGRVLSIPPEFVTFVK